MWIQKDFEFEGTFLECQVLLSLYLEKNYNVTLKGFGNLDHILNLSSIVVSLPLRITCHLEGFKILGHILNVSSIALSFKVFNVT
jgi:hypothetical protein